MKQYESQVRYRQTAQSQGFAPIQGPNLAPALRRNLEDQAQSIQNVQRAQLENYKKDELELENIDPNLIKQLSTFSDTLMTFGKEQARAYDEAEQAAALAYFYENEEELTSERVSFNNGESIVNNVHNVSQQAAIDASRSGSPYEATSALEDLSGRRKLYVAVHAAKAIAGQYQTFLTDGLAEDTTVLNLDGVELPVNKQNKTTQEEAAARAYLREQFMRNFKGIPRGLLAEHAFPVMSQTDSRLAEAHRNEVAIRESDVKRQEAYQTFFTNYETNPDSVSQLLNTLALTVDSKGNRLGYTGAWKKFEQFAKDMAGSENAIDFDAVRRQKVLGDPKNRTFDELYDVKLTALEDDIQTEQNAKFSQDQATTRNLLKVKEQEIVQRLQEEEVATDAEVDLALEQYRKYANSHGMDGKSQAIESFKTHGTEEAQIRKAKIDQYTYQMKRGQLDPDVISLEGSVIRNQFLAIAQSQEKQRNETGGTKAKLKAIDALVKNQKNISVLPDGSTGATPTLIISELQDEFLRAHQKYLGTPEYENNSAGAALVAYQDIRNQFLTDLKDPDARYYLDDKGRFPRFDDAVGHDTHVKELQADLSKINSALKSSGLSALDKADANGRALFGDKAYFEKLEEGYLQRGWRVPRSISYWAKVLERDPFEIINRQRKALGMDALPAYEQLVEQTKQVSPDFRRFLNDLVSGSATQYQLRRAVSPVASLPVRPAFANAESTALSKLYTAITGKESGGNYGAVNRDSKALGIGQIMPDNISAWTKRHLGYEMTPQQFLDNPVAQEKVVSGQLGLIMQDQIAAGYSGEEMVRRAAAIWYSGNGNLWNNTKPQYYNGNPYPSIADYTKDIWRRFSGQ